MYILFLLQNKTSQHPTIQFLGNEGVSEYSAISVVNSLACVISGFSRGVNKIFALLGFYAAQIVSLLSTFRDDL
jgi:hypothetical protein